MQRCGNMAHATHQDATAKAAPRSDVNAMSHCASASMHTRFNQSTMMVRTGDMTPWGRKYKPVCPETRQFNLTFCARPLWAGKITYCICTPKPMCTAWGIGRVLLPSSSPSRCLLALVPQTLARPWKGRCQLPACHTTVFLLQDSRMTVLNLGSHSISNNNLQQRHAGKKHSKSVGNTYRTTNYLTQFNQPIAYGE
jgi:hypothetical protein